MARGLSNIYMRLLLKHPFLLFFVLGVGGLLAWKVWRSNPEKAPIAERDTPPNLSIIVTRLPGTDLLHLFVQNLDPAKGSLISQEVFTLQRVGNGATIAHYTSSSPDFLSPAAVSQKRSDGTTLLPEEQTALQTWMREQLETRLRQLDTALQARTTLGVFVALRMVHEGQEKHQGKAPNIRPWVFIPSQQTPSNTPSSAGTPLNLQLQLALDSTAYENLETFAKRLHNEFQQRSSSAK
jgi:hypothetical protein